MTTQLTLFAADQPPAAIAPTDPALPPEAIPRLGKQNRRVLERLRVAPCTNIMLELLCGRVNSRIADVRRHLQTYHGQTIKCHPVNVKTGIYIYEIVPIEE